MGSIQTRKQKDGTPSYRAQVRIRGEVPHTKTFARKTDAKDWIRRIEEGIKNGEAPNPEAGKTTLAEALGRYLREITPRKKGADRERNRILAWQRDPLSRKFLTALRGKDLAEYRDARREQGAAESTIRSELALVSHVYTIARKDWGMVGLKNPLKDMTLPGSSRERNRRLEAGEEERLQAALAGTPYVAEIAAVAIESGMRQGELLGLTWADLDSEKRIARLRDTKSGEAREVPLSRAAMHLIKSLPRPLDPGSRVFQISQNALIKSFRKACTAAGIADLRFHDLRHEAISRLFERGLNVAEVAAISGHRTWSQLRRYTKLRAEDLVLKLA
jgi:integrase